MRYIIVLVILLMFINSYSQQDSLTGYGDFVFGQTLGEVKKILDRNGKYYNDTEQNKRSIAGNCYIKLNDVIKASSPKDWKYIYFPMDIRLYFDSLNYLKFYKATINIKNECKTLQEAFEQTEIVLDILIKKYSSNFDMEDFMNYGEVGVQKIGDKMVFVHPKSKIYTWKFLNATVELNNDFSDFYKDSLKDFQISGFGDKEYENRKYYIRITYSDINLTRERDQRRRVKYEIEKNKEEEEKLKKF